MDRTDQESAEQKEDQPTAKLGVNFSQLLLIPITIAVWSRLSDHFELPELLEKITFHWREFFLRVWKDLLEPLGFQIGNFTADALTFLSLMLSPYLVSFIGRRMWKHFRSTPKPVSNAHIHAISACLLVVVFFAPWPIWDKLERPDLPGSPTMTLVTAPGVLKFGGDGIIGPFAPVSLSFWDLLLHWEYWVSWLTVLASVIFAYLGFHGPRSIVSRPAVASLLVSISYVASVLMVFQNSLSSPESSVVERLVAVLLSGILALCIPFVVLARPTLRHTQILACVAAVWIAAGVVGLGGPFLDYITGVLQRIGSSEH